jgi:hypothetical protein
MALAVTAFRQQNEFIDILLGALDKTSDLLVDTDRQGEGDTAFLSIVSYILYSIRHTLMMMLLLMGMLRSVLLVTMCSQT